VSQLQSLCPQSQPQLIQFPVESVDGQNPVPPYQEYQEYQPA
jgi:hypothetical protein